MKKHLLNREILNDRYDLNLETDYSQKVQKKNTGKVFRYEKNNPFSPKEAQKYVNVEDVHQEGLNNLIIQGRLPPHVDLSTMISTYPSPITTAPVQFHSFQEKKNNPNPRVLSRENYTQQNIKYDLFTTVGVGRKKKKNEKTNNSGFPSLSIKQFPQPIRKKKTGKKKNTNRKTREYEELQDLHARHDLIIRRGEIIEEHEEFKSFKRKYSHNWGEILQILKELEYYCKIHDIPIVFVSGKRVVELSETFMGETDQKELISCILNYEDVVIVKNENKTNFQGKNGLNRAATMIQKNWKMHMAKKKYKVLLDREMAARKIYKQWLLRKNYFNTKKKIKTEFEKKEEKWRLKMKDFRDNWEKIEKEDKLIIHICSISGNKFQRNNISKYCLRQNSQYYRILDLLKDKRTNLIILSPYGDNEEIDEYFKTLEVCNELGEWEKRVTVLVPEYAEILPDEMSIMRKLYYSPRTMTFLKNKIIGRNAYIVPGRIGMEDYKVAVNLCVPLMSAPVEEGKEFGSKTGIKKLFRLANIHTAPGEFGLSNLTDVVLHLSKLIIQRPNFSKWIIKINNEIFSRGIAVLEVNKMICLKSRYREKLLNGLKKKGITDQMIDQLRDKVYFELREGIQNRIKFVMPHVYRKWDNFVKAIKNSGCIIEAVPNEVISNPIVNVFIHPTGKIDILSIQEQIVYNNFKVAAVGYPSTTVPEKALKEATHSVARVLHQKGCIGYVSVEYVAFLDQNRKLRIWGVDIELQRTDSSVIHEFFIAECGKIYKDLCYVYTNLLYHSDFTYWRHEIFLANCKQKGLLFSREKQRGIIFQFPSTIMKGAVGALCIAKSHNGALEVLSEFLSIVQLRGEQTTLSNRGESNLIGINAIVKNLSIKKM